MCLHDLLCLLVVIISWHSIITHNIKCYLKVLPNKCLKLTAIWLLMLMTVFGKCFVFLMSCHLQKLQVCVLDRILSYFLKLGYSHLKICSRLMFV
jgi:hypothetical protein